ncbi:hypothetical protein OAO01_06555 [Oligoflexia bacterium]|nr:hypothetical protein [Oligoflexia bacterium]
MTHVLHSIGKDKVFLLIVLLIGLALRLDLLVANNFVIDADEAIVGLMAQHIGEGHKLPIFYYGQNYMGSFEGLLASLVFKAVGSSSVALKCVPLVFGLLLIVLIYQIGFELGGVFVARLSALLAAISPSTLIIWSAKARGGFIELICIGAIALILTLQWLKADNASFLRIALIGFLLGFGWWVNNQIIYFMLPIGFVILGRLVYQQKTVVNRVGDVLFSLGCGGLAFIVGGLPFWLFNLKEDFVSFQMFHSSQAVDVLGQLGGVFSTALPILLGAKRFWQTSDLFLFSTVLIWAVYVLLVLILFSGRKRNISGLARMRIGADSGIELLIVFVFGAVCVFSLSSFGYLVEAPRYLLPLYCGIFPLSAVAIGYLKERNAFIAYSCVAGLLVINLSSSYLGGRAVPGEPFVFKGERVSKDHAALITWLDKHEFAWVRTNYWIGYRLAFETQERIRFLLVQKPYQQRIPAYKIDGEAYGLDRMPFVLVPTQAAIIESALNALGYTYSVADVSGYRVLYDMLPKQKDLVLLDREVYAATASAHPEVAFNVHDGDRVTRWGSALPQTPAMEFTLNFAQPTSIRAFRYDMGQWIHDYPRGLKVEVELETGDIQALISSEQYQAIRYLVEYGSTWSIYFEPLVAKRLKFTQLGAHPVFDWSIAEIEVYQ